jgi:wyosine [tRNA(Phe)-imidazoG37] synthetase (radical SAM superfamily)
MATFLFDDIIFGPVRSRRLGASLGINLLPTNGKLCNFNCIYCECGWSTGSTGDTKLPSREDIAHHLEVRLLQILRDKTPIDIITFAGNGEPTLHPEFAGIIADTIEIRNRIFPDVKIAVLSNASRLDHPGVFDALGSIEMNILKLDSAHDRTVKLINQPQSGYHVDKVIEGMMRYNGKFILQTLFIKGEFNGAIVDNTEKQEIEDWLELVKKVNPEMVMIYTISRDTPIQTLQKIEPAILNRIAKEVSGLLIPVQVSY